MIAASAAEVKAKIHKIYLNAEIYYNYVQQDLRLM